MHIKRINPWSWQDNLGFNQALIVNDRELIASGQAAMSADGRPMHAGDMAAQVKLSLENLETVMKEAEFGYDSLVRLNIYTTDVQEFFKSYGILLERMAGKAQYACTLIGVKELAFPELMVELEATFTEG